MGTVASFTAFASSVISTSHTLTYPTAVIDGDELGILCSVGSADAPNTPAGWTLRGSIVDSGISCSYYTRVASSEPGTINITFPASRHLVAHFIRVTGASGFDSIAAQTNSTPSLIVQCPSVVPTDTNALVLWGFCVDGISAQTDAGNPLNTVLLASRNSGAGDSCGGGMSYTIETGATGTKDWDLALSDNSIGAVISYLEPDGGVPIINKLSLNIGLAIGI